MQNPDALETKLKREIAEMMEKRAHLAAELEKLDVQVKRRQKTYADIHREPLTKHVYRGTVADKVHRVIAVSGHYGITTLDIRDVLRDEVPKHIAIALDRLVKKALVVAIPRSIPRIGVGAQHERVFYATEFAPVSPEEAAPEPKDPLKDLGFIAE
jgi:hypothetical protein